MGVRVEKSSAKKSGLKNPVLKSNIKNALVPPTPILLVAITSNDKCPDPVVTQKPAVTKAPRDQPKESSNPLRISKPLPTNTGTLGKKSSLKRGQDIELHSPVKSKKAKLDVETTYQKLALQQQATTRIIQLS